MAEGDTKEDGETRFIRADRSTMLAQRTAAVEPKSRIEMTFEPNWADNRTPSRVAFRIAAEGPLCRLATEHYALPESQAGVKEGWVRWASPLKSWLEAGEAMKLPM